MKKILRTKDIIIEEKNNVAVREELRGDPYIYFSHDLSKFEVKEEVENMSNQTFVATETDP